MPNELMKTLTVGANTYDLPQKTSDLTNDSGFITSESDPVFTASAAHGITSTNITNWNNKGTYSKPSGGIPKTDLASAVQTSLGKADTALQSYTETDPTVPSWAKASSKPTYTASEVGALPDTTAIPTNTSDLTNDSGFITGMTVLSYGNSTWADFEAAYNANKVVYCRASSNANPASGSQTRLAFMAYVNNATTPTNVEFQYYRSVSTHTASQQGDQVFVYKLDKTSGWSVTTREASVKVVAGDGLGGTYSNGTMTLTGPTKVSDLTNDSGFITGYTETDPVFSASAAAGISSSDITNWNGKAETSALSGYLPLTGGTLTGVLNHGSQSAPLSSGTDHFKDYIPVDSSGTWADWAVADSDGHYVGKIRWRHGSVNNILQFMVYNPSTHEYAIPMQLTSNTTTTFGEIINDPDAGDSSRKIPSTGWVQAEITDSLGDYLPLSGGTMTGMVDFGTAAAPISSTVLMQGYVGGGSSATERTYKDLIQLANADGNRVAVVRAIDDVGYNELDLMVFSENNNPTNAATFTNTNGTKTARIYGDLTILSPSAGDNSTHAASTAWAQNEFKYKSGDVVNVGGGVFAGYFDSSKNLYFHIPLNKDLARISSASISTDTSWAIFCAGSVLLSNATLASFGTITCTKTDTGVLVKVVPSSTASITARQTVSVRANGAYITLT